MIEDKYLKNSDHTLVETQQELWDRTIENITSILTENYPEYLVFGNGSFTISRGSTQVMIIVRPFTDDETCIEFLANVVTGATITEDLMRFLLRKNAEIHFGH